MAGDNLGRCSVDEKASIKQPERSPAMKWMGGNHGLDNLCDGL